VSSDWDVITTVFGSVVGSVAGPIGTVAGAVAGEVFGDGDKPTRMGTAPPYPGTVPGVPPAPAPGAPAPGPPPPSPPGSSGAAADADRADASDIGSAIDELSQLDKKSADAVAAIKEAGDSGRRALDDIVAAVDAKITELGPRLNSPAGQQELRDFLRGKLTAAKQILDEQNQIALDKAREVREIAERYGQIGTPAGSDGDAKPSDGNGGPASSASDTGSNSVPPAASPTPESAPTTPAGSPTPMPPMMPGMSPAAMMPQIPGFGGGGVPGGGITDPLSALGGLGHSSPDDGLKLADDPHSGSGDPSKDSPHVHDDPLSPSAGDHHDAGNDASGTTDPGTHAAAAPDTGGPAPAAADTDVRLPDGTTAHAPNGHAADAVRAALNGASVSQAYQQAGITVPPAGTPVLDPVAPGDLRAGDVGVWKDHLVMALGDGKVLVSGQVQPQSSVGSGPDFLGWMRPARDGHPPTPNPPPAAPGPAAS
jgi:hypothetical protein